MVSLFVDMTYEAAGSIAESYPAVLGTGAPVVGMLDGFGEPDGYGLRLAYGLFSDRSERYWTITITG